MAADRQSREAIRQWLVRHGHLCFDDFLLIEPETMDFGHWTPNMSSDWALATNNAPHIQVRFHPSHCNLQTADCKLEPSLGDVQAAQQRLIAHFAYELLRAKAPPLYDALPWHDWDFSIVAKRFKLWQTRFLLAGDGTTVTMCRCRRSAGVYVVEPDEIIARYVERKAQAEKVRRFRLLRSSITPSLPLPFFSVDLAILGSVSSLDTDNWRLVIDELIRVAANVLLIENNPLALPLPDTPLAAIGFKPDSVVVSGIGPRRCWWKWAMTADD
jgi:hypothetical protein